MNVYRTETGLRHAIRDVLNFYYPDCVDTTYGGYVAGIDEREGFVYDARTKHLVATARAVHNFSVGVLLDGPDWCRFAAEHGLSFLSTVHWDAENGGYDWLLSGRETVDDTRHCYGHAFVVLAAARALQAGIPGAERELERAVDVIEERFWEPEHGLYADRADAEWDDVSPYRGQNANMHTCEAMLAAYEATDEERYLDRAHAIAESFVREVTRQTNGLLWEHYDEGWEADLSYNRDEPRHQFRPWGYQPGHHAEWAKLLLLLREHRPQPWLVERATELFDAAMDLGWDGEHGGLHYTTDADGDPVVADKYGWVHTEAIGASALLARHDESYLETYDRLWDYAEAHLIDPKYGNWYERVAPDGEHDKPNHGVAVEPGYHPLNNAWAAMDAFGAETLEAGTPGTDVPDE